MNRRNLLLTAAGVALLAGATGAATKQAQTPQATQTPQMPPPPLWTEAERKAVVAYWNAPGRYVVEEKPADVPPYVNITVGGSEWYWEYVRALPDVKKANPKQAAKWENAFEQQLRFARDRADKTLKHYIDQTVVPPSLADLEAEAGGLPADLEAQAGQTPRFYEVAQPAQHSITFAPEDGPAAPFVYTDNLDFTRPKPYYAYYRSPNGVRKFGTRLKAMTGPQKAEVDALFKSVASKPFEQHVLAAVSALEGGFEAINTYDTGWVSIGFIQFITKIDGTGSLASVLATHKKNDPKDFAQTFHRFGIDVDGAGVVSVCDPKNGEERHGEAAVDTIINDKRLTAVFERAGSMPGFRKAQVQVARAQYWPGDDAITVVRQTLSEQSGTGTLTPNSVYHTAPDAAKTPPAFQTVLDAQAEKQKTDPEYRAAVDTAVLTGKVSDIIKSEAGMATLMDRKVNRGNLGSINEAVAQIMQDNQLSKIAQVAAFEKTLMAAMKYRADYLTDPALTQPPNPPSKK